MWNSVLPAYCARDSWRGTCVVIRTDRLHVRDAKNRELPSRIVSRGRISELRVSTTGATYPIVVDPILSGTAESTLQSNQYLAYFGINVAARST